MRERIYFHIDFRGRLCHGTPVIVYQMNLTMMFRDRAWGDYVL